MPNLDFLSKITLTGGITAISNAILGIVGFVAVLFIIIGGVRYLTAAGNPEQIQSAKSNILYGIIGLVVILLSYAIVNYVIGSITTGHPTSLLFLI